MNLQPVKAQPPLTFGTAIHKALETYYDPTTARDPEKATQAFEKSMTDWYRSLPDQLQAKGDLQDEYREALTLGVGMLKHYFAWAPKNDDFEVVWVEKAYTIPLEGLSADYSFKPDGLVRDNKAGKLWIIEHKTARTIPETLEDYLLIDDQCGSYLWGILEAEGLEIEGVIYNTLRKKTPQPLRVLKDGSFSVAANQDTTYEYAYREIMENHGPDISHYQDFLDHLKAKGNTFFSRHKVRRNRKEIEALGNAIRMEVFEMLDDPNIYRNPSRFNCSNCAFMGPCIAYYEGGDVETMLAGNYQERSKG